MEGPKTLNGLILEHLGDIPEAGTAFRLEGQMVEILQTQDRAVKVVKLLPPVGRGGRAFTNPGRAGIIDQLKFYANGIAVIFGAAGM